MNTIWILLWISSAPIIYDGENHGSTWTDRYDIRKSYGECVRRIKTLRDIGQGFGFKMYRSHRHKIEWPLNVEDPLLRIYDE